MLLEHEPIIKIDKKRTIFPHMKSTIFPLMGRGALIKRQVLNERGALFLVCTAKGQTRELSEHKEIEIACIPTIRKVRKEGEGGIYSRGVLA